MLMSIMQAGRVSKIVGIFIPTVKNKIVEKQYQAYGFRQSKELPDGGMEWNWMLNPTFIRNATF